MVEDTVVLAMVAQAATITDIQPISPGIRRVLRRHLPHLRENITLPAHRGPEQHREAGHVGPVHALGGDGRGTEPDAPGVPVRKRAGVQHQPGGGQPGTRGGPVDAEGAGSATIRWVSVPPVVTSKPSASRPAASTRAWATTWWAYAAKAGAAASPNATAFAATVCIWAPPCVKGNTARSIRSASSAPHRIIPPRGPRSTLCVVAQTTSAYGTGLGAAPRRSGPSGARSRR